MSGFPLIKPRPILKNAHLLLTFDAFGTLFRPKTPVAAQYMLVAREHGLDVEEADIEVAFRKAFREETRRNKNFGKDTGMMPGEWWTKVVTNTFTSLTSSALPSSLAPALIHRFASKEAYALCPGAIEVLRQIRLRSDKWLYSTTTIGVITNSDPRVLPILKDLGIRVRGYEPTTQGQSPQKTEGIGDKALIDFVTFSYDVGFKKPRKEIFEAAHKTWMDRLGLADTDATSQLVTTHVGNAYRQDFMGANGAGWNAILLDRGGKAAQRDDGGVGFIQDLGEIVSILEDQSEGLKNL